MATPGRYIASPASGVRISIPGSCTTVTWKSARAPDARKAIPASASATRNPRETAATPLAALLAERGIEHLVVVGLATDYCVKETVLDARRLGFPVTVLRGGIRAVNLAPGDGDRALEEMQGAGAVLE